MLSLLLGVVFVYEAHQYKVSRQRNHQIKIMEKIDYLYLCNCEYERHCIDDVLDCDEVYDNE